MSDSDIAERLEVALLLMEEGIAIRRQRLCREYPGETDEQISDRLHAYLINRPPPLGCRAGSAEELLRAVS